MVAYITELNETNYDRFVSDGIVLVDVWAAWCGPCKAISPIIDQISEEYNGKIKVGKCDADANRDKVMALGVRNIPTVLIYKDGEIVERFVGLKPKNEIIQLVEKQLN